MEFTEFNLHPDLQRGIAAAGYVTCMPVQEQVLTNAFGGQDLYVQSQTGTGKTAAFLVVIFQRLLLDPLVAGKKALIMAPTRELAVQIEEEAKVLGQFLPFVTGSFYGGVGYGDQQRLLRDHVQIMVGTPGRVLDLNSSGQMNLMDIAFLILDEADRMFDMGFYPDLRKLIRVVPPADRRQTMLFSATLNNWVKNLAWEYTKSPREIEIAPELVTVEEIEQALYHVPSGDKMKLLLGMLKREKPESAIIFCNTKRYVEIVAKRLRINGIDCEFIMGDLPQIKRLKIIEDVKAGKTRFLVATDVAARGLDIDSLAMVVNYDLPNEAENYVHRIGRTARAGKSGKAITLASEQDVYELPAIERYMGRKIPSEIAHPADYGEDKSEGMRIQTDFYAGRGSDRGRDSGRNRDSSRGRDDRDRSRSNGRSNGRSNDRSNDRRSDGGREAPRSGSRDAGRSDSQSDSQSGSQSAEGRRQDGRRAAGPGQSLGGRLGGDRQSGDRLGGGQPDISKLSFDERMAYYKGKYEGGRETAPRQQKGRAQGGAPSGQRPAQGKAQGRGNQSGAQSGTQAQARSPGSSPAKAPETAPAKKGILGKLLGIFKKK